jgi:putative transport protein
MTAITAFFASQPMFAQFFTIAAGYLLGAVSVKGLALGSGAVLFVGLAVLLFLYGIGIAYGAQFFRGLSTAAGLKANLAAAIAVVTALVLAQGAAWLVPAIDQPHALGAFAGAGTSTAALQAALAVLGAGPATAYSVAYPVGVAVPILLLALYNAWRKPQSAPRIAPTLHMEEVDVTEFNVVGMTLAEAAQRLPAGIAIAAIRRGHHNLLPAGTMALARGDVLLVTGADAHLLHDVAARFGPVHPGAMVHDRSDLDYERFFVSSPKVAGRRLAAVVLALAPGMKARILHLHLHLHLRRCW